jgi:hypothetical protein
MIELEIAGIGLWSPMFANSLEFSAGIRAGSWHDETRLQPDMIPARERRRAPLSVKMAVEVMAQACNMADFDPADAAVVFSSAMGDMHITDYLCETLASPPRLVSPTRFHNSVHNATTGYWSIAAQCNTPTNAVSAFGYTAPMALIEAAIQVHEEGRPVLLVMQEMAAPPALQISCPSSQPFTCSFLMTPKGHCSHSLASLRIEPAVGKIDWPELPTGLADEFKGNPAAKILPLISVLLNKQPGVPVKSGALANDHILNYPLSSNTCIKIRATVH